uniref:RAB, member of RAS oncogene family-like 3 n=1 Tax=Takifugu rubripes TaxID=31033 RepID=A0A674N573_TAKRU
MDNDRHPLHTVIHSQRSLISQRLRLPKYRTNRLGTHSSPEPSDCSTPHRGGGGPTGELEQHCNNIILGHPFIQFIHSFSSFIYISIVQDYKEGTPEEKAYYIELWDVGGSIGSASSVKSTRAVFYNSVNGIILVHDLTNKKSSQNLYRWSLEALNKDSSPTGVIVSNGEYDREQFAENPVPLLLIGTKFDQIPETKRSEVLTRTAFLSEDFNAEEINLVIEKRYFTRDPSQVSQVCINELAL